MPGGAAGCRKLFEDVLLLEYSDPAYRSVHLLTVDSYALQHSEDQGPRSNAFHLARLCMLLEHGGIGRFAARSLQKQLNGNRKMPFLEPPLNRGKMTIADVHGANGPEEHVKQVKRWARSVWKAWSDHHQWARQFLKKL